MISGTGFGFILQWHTGWYFNTTCTPADLNNTELDVLLNLSIPLTQELKVLLQFYFVPR